jgi:hypothetical protein
MAAQDAGISPSNVNSKIKEPPAVQENDPATSKQIANANAN